MLKIFYKPALVILITIIFFLSYNRFLLDRSLEDLKFSLDMMAKAESREDAENVKMVLELLLLDKVASKEFDTTELAALEYAHGVMVKGAEVGTRELKDATISIKETVEKKIKERVNQRGAVITTLDNINRGVIKGVDRLGDIPAALISREEEGEEIDAELLAQAISYDKEWRLVEAKKAYEALIAKYPNYREKKSIKLRLAYIYQKIGLYERAEELFNEIAKRYPQTLEAKAAEKLLLALQEIKKLAEGKNTLIKEIPSIVSKEKLQEAYYKLGMINIQLLDFIAAREAFNKAIEVNPSAELAMRAKFNLAWSYKFQTKLDEGISTFEELIQEYPEAKLVLDAKYQLADTYRRQGRYKEAIDAYERIAEEYKDSDIAPLTLLQSSMVYLYDLHDPEKAKEQFLKFREKHSDAEAARLKSEYAQELILEEKLPKGWLDAILLKGGIGFAHVVLGISGVESLGEKTPYEKIYTEKEMNEIVITMLKKIELENTVTDTRVNFIPSKIEGSALIKFGKLSLRAHGIVKAEAVRGGFKYTVERYRFTFGNSNIRLPVPRFLINRITNRMNTVLTKRNLGLSLEELVLTEDDLTIKGFRY